MRDDPLDDRPAKRDIVELHLALARHNLAEAVERARQRSEAIEQAKAHHPATAHQDPLDFDREAGGRPVEDVDPGEVL